MVGKCCFVYCGDDRCNCDKAPSMFKTNPYVKIPFWMLIGVPASGKSTYVDKLLKLEPEAVVISSDRYIDMMAEKEGTDYSRAFKKHIKGADQYMKNQLNLAKENNYPIIWDQTNLTIKSRAKKLEMIPAHYTKKAIVFPMPNKLELEKRLASRPGKFIPESVMKQMEDSYEVPLYMEGFDTIEFLELTWKP